MDFILYTSVQRAPRRGNKPPAQGKRAQRATPWVRPHAVRYAPGGGKSSGRGDFIGEFERAIAPFERGVAPFGHADVAFTRGVVAFGRGVRHHLNASVMAFAPSGGVSETPLPNPGCRSLRSLTLGYKLSLLRRSRDGLQPSTSPLRGLSQ